MEGYSNKVVSLEALLHGLLCIYSFEVVGASCRSKRLYEEKLKINKKLLWESKIKIV